MIPACDIMIRSLIIALSIVCLSKCLEITTLQRHYNDLITLLDEYKRQHSRKSIASDSRDQYCARNLGIISVETTCVGKAGIGSQLELETSALIIAVILNRTTIVSHRELSECEGLLGFQDWVIELKEFETYEKLFNCSDSTRKGNPLDTCISIASQSRIMEIWGDKEIYHQLKKDSYPLMSEESVRRSDVLFRSFSNHNGYFTSVGVIRKYFYGWSLKLQHTLPRKLFRDKDAVNIGIHIRHQADSFADQYIHEYDNQAMMAIRYLVQYTRNISSSCNLLVASDNESSIYLASNLSTEVHCTLIRHHHKRQQESSVSFNGPWSHAHATLRDMYLLEQSHYFIGSAMSTYSFQIASIVALNALRNGTEENKLLWLLDGNIVPDYIFALYGPRYQKYQCKT